MDGKEIWNGEVDVFKLTGHPRACKAFGWAYKDYQGEIQYIAILDTSSINSPREAVQAAIASGRFS